MCLGCRGEACPESSPRRTFTFSVRWAKIAYNLRRLGKRFLATLFFLDQWRRLRAPRSVIERCCAFLKRYYGLKYFQGEGQQAVWQYALLIRSAMLAVALIAYRAGRPDLMTSRAQVLAFVTT